MILNLTHKWKIVLLFNETNVFLKTRTTQDIYRNALMLIFLKLLKYF